ncbi:MAG TPA: hypothetical protein VK821_04120, partial [Dehalococcoidia bacterium]|nr:hypothetical protein [Dehalococcoidia bacterium]
AAGGPTPAAPATPADGGSTATTSTDETKAGADATQGQGTPALGMQSPTVAAPERGQELQVIATNGKANGHVANGNGAAKAMNGGGMTLNLGGVKVAFATQADAPSCMDCGSIMVRNGSCYKCLNCGSTSGCS